MTIEHPYRKAAIYNQLLFSPVKKKTKTGFVVEALKGSYLKTITKNRYDSK